MRRPTLIHPVCLAPPCAPRLHPEWLRVVSRDSQLRSGRVLRVGAASLARLVGLVAMGLGDSMGTKWFTRVDGPVNDDFRLVWRTLNACLNVETVACPANGSRIYTPTTRPVGLTLIGEPVHSW